MKLFSLLILLITGFVNTANACICHPFPDESQSATINRYDFIAHIKVKAARIYSFSPDNIENKSDFAQIEIIELFKGEKVDSIHVWGIGSSCDMGVQQGQEWVIYGNKFEKTYTTNMCTHSFRLMPETWQTDLPFFLSSVYLLKKYFDHPLPPLKDGVYQSSLPTKKLKSSYIVKRNKLEGDFFYRSSESGIVYNYHFKDGVLHGNSYKIGMLHKWILVSKYTNGQLNETIEYSIKDSIGLEIDLTNQQALDSSIKRQKALQYQQLFLPDKSVLTRSYHKDNSFNSIIHKDSTGQLLFSLQFSEEGKLKSHFILNQNSGISTFIAYYSDGIIERKIIRQPDKTHTSYFYNPDGSLKNVKED